MQARWMADRSKSFPGSPDRALQPAEGRRQWGLPRSNAPRSALTWVVAVITATTAHAATWHIEAEPEGNNRIAALAALAASGDTIMIGPGLYYEHIDAAGKTLTFIGREGRENTILDGSRPFAGEGGSIIYTYDRPGPISVVGLTLQHGQGSRTEGFLGRFGGAIHINSDIYRLFRLWGGRIC